MYSLIIFLLTITLISVVAVRYKTPYDPAEPRFNLNQNDWVWTCAAVASGSKPQVR